MTTRAQQREETREKILAAATTIFANHGFNGASTREIASLAGVNQGLLTYHFQNKDALWRAAADRLFNEMRETMAAELDNTVDPVTFARDMIKAYVRFVARKPELFRFMLEEGGGSRERFEWLVETYLRPGFEFFAETSGFDKHSLPHAFYTMIGAGSVVFAVSNECQMLTGVDTSRTRVIEAHADFVARLLIPD